MIDDFTTLPKKSEPFTVSDGHRRDAASRPRREDLILADLVANQKRDLAFARELAIAIGVIMAVLFFIVIAAAVQFFETLDAPAVSGFKPTVRSDPSLSGAGAECKPFHKCQSFRRDGVDG